MNAPSSVLNKFDMSFRLIGPLPTIGIADRADYFIESENAHGHYVAHRSSVSVCCSHLVTSALAHHSAIFPGAEVIDGNEQSGALD